MILLIDMPEWFNTMNNATSLVIGLLIGSLISLVITYIFYKKSGSDLANEAKKLRKLNTIMLNAMENSGLTKINRDENGEPIGLIINVSSVITGTSSVTANAHVKHSNNNDENLFR